jgi:hypothetical protein
MEKEVFKLCPRDGTMEWGHVAVKGANGGTWFGEMAQAVNAWRNDIWSAACSVESFALFFRVDSAAGERFAFDCSVCQGEINVSLFCLICGWRYGGQMFAQLGLLGERTPT